MSKYKITGIIYIHTGMNEWVKFDTWELPHKHCVFTAPDEHMPYIIQLHIMSILWTYYEQIKQQNIWSVHMANIGKENRSSQCLSYKEWWGGGGGGGRQLEGMGRVVWVYKIGLKWPVIAMAITRKPQSLSLCLKETENWNSSSKTLFYKDCSLGSVKNPSNN